ENCIHRPNGHQIVTLDAPTCVEDKNHKTFTFRIEVRMIRDVRLPIGGCLIRCFALLHVVGCGTFPERNNFPFLRLSREFDRLDDVICGLRSSCGASVGDEVFCRVHVLRFVLKRAGLLSSPQPRESSPAPNETTPPVPAPPGGGASATE